MTKKALLLLMIGAFAGAIAGLLYYNYYGCTSGCAITGSPRNSMAYFAVMGALAVSSFSKTKHTKE